jgi:small subunit ribosomal protein S2
MAKVTVKELIDAGAHFGHQTQKWNPKMKHYIFDKKNGIHIINLDKTAVLLEQAALFVRNLVANGGKILFVGTKKQAQELIAKTAKSVNMYYVSERWLGGMLTNNKTIRQSVNKLEQFLTMETDGTFEKMSKRDQSTFLKEKMRLVKNLDGVKDMKTLPAAMFVVDTGYESNAIAEAKKLSIPLISILDTNCDPDPIDYPIPANDDSIRTIECILEALKAAVIEGQNIWQKTEQDRKSKEEKAKADAEAQREDARKKSEEIKKVKADLEAKEKLKVDSIIADLQKNA